jgi:hypothetical protein
LKVGECIGVVLFEVWPNPIWTIVFKSSSENVNGYWKSLEKQKVN